jgi:hypothetical protein
MLIKYFRSDSMFFVYFPEPARLSSSSANFKKQMGVLGFSWLHGGFVVCLVIFEGCGIWVPTGLMLAARSSYQS